MRRYIFVGTVVSWLLFSTGCSWFQYNAKAFSSPEDFPPKSSPKEGILHVVQGDIESPYQTVCHINVNRRHIVLGKNWPSSASVIRVEGNYVLITAAHNLVEKCFSKPKEFVMECGVGTREKQEPIYRTKVKIDGNVFVNPNYDLGSCNRGRKNDFPNDLALVRLPADSDIPTSQFTLASEVHLSSVNEGTTIYVAGYPGKQNNKLSFLWTKVKVRDSEKPTKLSYESRDTGKGLSGGPVWIENGDKKILIGVHTFGHDKQITDSGAYIFDKEMRDKLEKWLGEI